VDEEEIAFLAVPVMRGVVDVMKVWKERKREPRWRGFGGASGLIA
jgi:hypothetical protein